MYQLKQALPYTREHLDTDGNYIFELYEEEIDILHVKMRSRHSSQVTHNIWIGYGSNLKLTEGQNPISERYCSCKAGARIFGMCEHITSVIWYLGIAGNDSNHLKIRKSDFFLNLCKSSGTEIETVDE